nr:TAXI family TRAP transporter solute-binding subunit [Sedimentibacter sp.]
MRRKFLSVIASIVFALALLTACSGGSTDTSQGNGDNGGITQLRVGGAGTTTWSYSCLVAVSEAIKQKDPSIDLVIQSTPGSTTHYAMFKNGELDLGSGYTPTDYWALNGIAPLYDEKYDDCFYTLAPVTVSKTQIIVDKNSSIQSIQDLNGKKVFVGDPGAAATALAVEIVDALQLDIQSIQTDRNEGFEMLKDGRVDAVIQNTGVPYASVLEVASAIPLRIIPFTDEEIETCLARGPYNTVGEITSSDYDFVTEPVKTLTQIQNINISSKVSDDVAYKIAKAISESWDDVVATVPAAGKVSPVEDIDKSVAKIHPGAIKYYEEQGVKIPDKLKP